MRFLFVVHKNEEKAEQNSVLFHRLTLKERGLRPNGYFPLMRQPLNCFTNTCLSAALFRARWLDNANCKAGRSARADEICERARRNTETEKQQRKKENRRGETDRS